jgi:hypothetical protein
VTLKRVGTERFSLARWSRRKLGSALQDAAAAAQSPASAPPVPATAAPSALPSTAASPELPAVESLTFASDFTPFLRPGVDADLKRAALKRLLRDPSFNVMDGLDVYIDDYTKADPIPPDMLSELIERFDFGDSAASEPVAAATDSPAEAPARQEPAASAGGAASATALPVAAGEASPSAPASAERTDDTIALPGAPETSAGARNAE